MNELIDLVFTSIDFGTTFSGIGYVTRSSSTGGVNPPKAVKCSDLPKIPTAVFVRSDDKKPYVGQKAVDEAYKNPDNFFTEFKLKLTDPKPLRHLPDGRAPTARLLTKYVLKRLRNCAEGKGVSLDKSIICHPVGMRWSHEMLAIAKEVGLDNVNTMTEPLAALYYADYLHSIFDDRSQMTLLVDFGGGTCDLFLLKVTTGFKSGRFRIGFGRKPIDQAQLTYHTPDDVRSYGGKDIDNLLIESFKEKWKAKYPRLASECQRLSEPRYRWKLATEARKAKERLSTYLTTGEEYSHSVEITGLPRNTKLSFDLSVEEFEKLVRPDIEAKFRDFLNDKEEGFFGRNKLKGRSIDRVILTGGSGRLPWLFDILAEICPIAGMRGQIHRLEEPEMSVAYGAALFNYYLQLGELPVPVLLEDTLKIGIDGGVYTLAKKNTRLPYFPTQFRANHFIRLKDVRDTIDVRLYTGERKLESECQPLGEPRPIEFGQKLSAGTILTYQVRIDQMGRVELTVFPVFKPQMARKAIFETLRVR